MNHTVITLHGRGGIGKTSLALQVLHQLISSGGDRFDHYIWLSARDLDLRASGPVPVQRAVTDLQSVCKRLGQLLVGTGTTQAFASVLKDPTPANASGILFVFDNFETMDDLVGLHQFLDTHTHHPNKVLLTSRERAFKGDFPIEVRGMERPEALEMIRAVAGQLNIAGRLSDRDREDLVSRTDGHPYVIRVILGEIAKAGLGQPISVKDLLPRRPDVIEVVFQRSFNKFSHDGRWIFLCVSNWRSAVSDVALTVVLLPRDIDVAAGLEECVRLSLLTCDLGEDGRPYYSAPELARAFGRKKLEGDPDKVAIDDSVRLLREFGVVAGRPAADSEQRQVRQFVEWCIQSALADRERAANVDQLLTGLAEFIPTAWSDVAEFREQFGLPSADIEAAHRRAVEEQPQSVEARRARAQYADRVGDQQTRIASLVSAVELKPGDVNFVREVAGVVIDFVTKNKFVIPVHRRGSYLNVVRSAMVNIADRLDATGLSRLAWLFLLEKDEPKARQYAAKGLTIEAGNEDCRKILQRLPNSSAG